MDNRSKNKWQIRLAVVMLFAIGFVAGALAMNMYRDRYSSMARGEGRGRFEQMVKGLNLTPEQETQVRAIFDDVRLQLREIRKESEPRFREVRRQADERLQSVLTPEQWERFQQIRSESRGRHNGRGRGERRPPQ